MPGAADALLGEKSRRFNADLQFAPCAMVNKFRNGSFTLRCKLARNVGCVGAKR
jgi:hypothetical protein